MLWWSICLLISSQVKVIWNLQGSTRSKKDPWRAPHASHLELASGTQDWVNVRHCLRVNKVVWNFRLSVVNLPQPFKHLHSNSHEIFPSLDWSQPSFIPSARAKNPIHQRHSLEADLKCLLIHHLPHAQFPTIHSSATFISTIWSKH